MFDSRVDNISPETMRGIRLNNVVYKKCKEKAVKLNSNFKD